MKNKKGFTLIEMLVVTSIITIISASVGTVFVSGLNLWKRGGRESSVDRDVRISLEKLSRDFNNFRPMSTLSFNGDTQNVSFPALVAQISQENKKIYFELKQVKYSFDKEEKTFTRTEYTYPEIFSEDKNAGKSKVIISSLEDIEISYKVWSGQEQDYTDRESWQSTNAPIAVNFKMTLKDGDILTKTVFI